MKAGPDPVEDLRRWLDENRGCLEQQKDELGDLLSCAWDQFAGANQERMRVDKLSRLEAPKWDPPILSFTIERHGAIVAGGSTRAEIQSWSLNFDDRVAGSGKAGWRQIYPRQPGIKVGEIAHQIAQAVAKRDKADPRLAWKADQVRIKLDQITGLAAGAAVQQTLTGRRRRFRAAIVGEMAKVGFVPRRDLSGRASSYVFVPAD